jgi:hypothetical protein
MITFGSKKIRVTLGIENPIVNMDGSIENRTESSIVTEKGDSLYERVFDTCNVLKSKVFTVKSSDIIKINMNHLVYCEAKAISENTLFNSGELTIKELKNKTRIFPIDNIAILKNDGNTISNITLLCSIDKINGIVIIPPSEIGIFSFIYSHKRVSVISSKKVQIPSTNIFGISTITI